jgi:hypothetical protein
MRRSRVQIPPAALLSFALARLLEARTRSGSLLGATVLMADDRSDNGFWTHTRTCVVLALAVALLSWCVAAASYSRSTEPETQPGYEVLRAPSTPGGRRALLVRLAIEGIAQLPNLHHVVGYAIWEKPWLMGLFLGLEAAPSAPGSSCVVSSGNWKNRRRRY